MWFSVFLTQQINEMETHQASILIHLSRSQPQEDSLLSSFTVGLEPKTLATYYETHAQMGPKADAAVSTSRYLNAALILYFRLAAQEALEFNKPDFIEKHAIMKDGILLSKGRIIDGMNFLQSSDLENLNLGSLGIKSMIPIIDRFSPLAYSIAQHIHWTVANHKGMETCQRISLEHVNILQGMSLYRELNEVCLKCKKKRGRFIKASMGPLSEKQLIIAPAFYAVQIDLCGPFRVFVPGFEKETRATKVKESKVWIMVIVCLVTSNVNLQVCEMKDAETMLEALIRLSCEVGYPKYIACDKEASIMKVLKDVDVNLRDLQHNLYKERGVIMETCPVGAHDQHGKVERSIRSIQDSLADVGLDSMRVHSIGLQTLCKQVENAYNNLPLGYRYGRDQDNTEVLKLLVPNMLKVGRINSRAMDGPVKISGDNKKILSNIQGKFETWYRNWLDVYVPKLMAQKKWFKNERDLAEGDLVYYKKKEGNELSSPWVVGQVENIFRGRDGVIRRAIIKYQNANEDFKRETERSVRKLIKLYSCDDPDLQSDLSELQRRLDLLEGRDDQTSAEGNNLHFYFSNRLQLQEQPTSAKDANGSINCQCCCQAHCRVNFHNSRGNKTFYPDEFDVCRNEFSLVSLVSEFGRDHAFSSVQNVNEDEAIYNEEDHITSMIMGTNLNLD